MIRHVFIDLDGVLVDFASEACRLHGRPDFPETGFAAWPKGEWNMAKVFGITDDEFWRLIDSYGEEFWFDLEPYPWMGDLLDNMPAPFTIATSPSNLPACASGKVKWMRHHLGRRSGRQFRDFLIGPQKHLLAGFGTVLIDDNDKKVSEFREAGGRAILFPQPWNANHALADDPLGHVLEELRAFA